MNAPITRSAYKAYYDVLDQAMDSPNGIRVRVGSRGDAMHFRVRLHKARQLDRDLNCLSRAPDDPEYGISDYDALIVLVRHEDGEWWVHIKRNIIEHEIEELTA